MDSLNAHSTSYPDVEPPSYQDVQALLGLASTNTHPYLPSFDEVMTTYEVEDSIRLPSYQARPIRRYHPYLHIRPVSSPRPNDETRYYNTIFDEECIELEVPPPLPYFPASLHAIPPHDLPTSQQAAAAAVAPTIAALVAANEVDETEGRIRAVAPLLTHIREAREALDLEEQHRQRIHRLRYLIPEFIMAVREAIAAASHVMEPPATPTPPRDSSGLMVFARPIEP